MSYQLNKTDGTILTDLVDGQIDNTTTNLTLVGKNYTGYGEAFNENFIRLLESFSSTSAPSNPLEGQVWWDKSDKRLKVYDGQQWKASGGPFVQDESPTMVAGDLWIDNLNNQFYAYDGSDLILVGPGYTATQQETGFRVESILDTQSRSRTIASLYVGGVIVAVVSELEFTPTYSQRITGLITDANPDGIIYKGFNIVDKDNFKYRGIAESANALVTAGGVVRTADSFLPSTSNGTTTGTLTVSNNGGITLGLSQNVVQRIVGPRFYIENQITDEDISLRVKSSQAGSVTVDAIYIDASTERVGIFTKDATGTSSRLPEYTLDVDGDLRVTGNLLVEGETTSIDVATLRVEDKNIELAKTSDGTVVTGANADEGGLILSTSDVGNKNWIWINATNSWTSNVNADLSDNTRAYKIGGQDKLTNDSLANILYADDLVRIGTLVELNVDDINLDGATITASPSAGTFAIVSNNGINITAAGDIAVQDSQKITGLADPTDLQDAATKNYVDSSIAEEPIVFSMDTTGLGTGATLENNVATIIQSMYPAHTINIGKNAKVHATSYAGAIVEGIDVSVTLSPDTSGVLTKSALDVDSNGTQNESVVQDIVASNTASGNVILTPTRTLMTFSSNGTTWDHVSTTSPYSF